MGLLAKILACKPIATAIINRAQRTPDEHLAGYMNRYWLFNPYDRETHTARYPWIPLSIRVHHILRRDTGGDQHDHPWNARTFILRGGYIEMRGTDMHCRVEGETATLRHNEFHEITHVTHRGVWTMFVMGRYRGRWGFLVRGKKVDFATYLADE